MTKFIYKDNSKGEYQNGKWVAPIVFSCITETIEVADKEYKIATGFDVVKQPGIGCSLEKVGPLA